MQTMNLDKLLKRLESTRARPWKVTAGGRIRCNGKCPLAVVANDMAKAGELSPNWNGASFNTTEVRYAAIAIGADSIAPFVVSAADNRDTYAPRTRKRMLAAVGLA